jgi:hypothetical protein
MSSSAVPGSRTALLKVEELENRSLPSTAAYVTALYQGVLHRDPAATEVAYWSLQLNNGVSPESIVNAFTASPEYRADLIQGDYQRFLGRKPAPTETNYWSDQLKSGLGENQLQADFLGSPEYSAEHGNKDADWLAGIYHDVLGRPLDKTGGDYWLGRLKAGATHTQVALEIYTSPESLTDFVTGVYKDFLGRDPDAAGLSYWVGSLEKGLTPSQFLGKIAAADEFINRQGGLDNNAPGGSYAPDPVDGFGYDPFFFPIGTGSIGGTVTAPAFTGGSTSGFTGGYNGGASTSGFTGGFTGGSATGC